MPDPDVVEALKRCGQPTQGRVVVYRSVSADEARFIENTSKPRFDASGRAWVATRPEIVDLQSATGYPDDALAEFDVDADDLIHQETRDSDEGKVDLLIVTSTVDIRLRGLTWMAAVPAVDVGVLAMGFKAALGRFETVDPKNADEAFLPLFEMLNWASAIDDRCATHFAPDGLCSMPGRDWQKRLTGNEILRGVRYARNVAHHRWAEVVKCESDGWTWRPTEQLPLATDGHRDYGREDYRRELAGKPVVRTLRSLVPDFALIARLLDSSGSIAGARRASHRASQLG